MAGYKDSLDLEAKGEAIIFDWLRNLGCTVIFNRNDHRGKEFQTYGDLIVRPPEQSKHMLVELKVEKSGRHGNFFIETWSNRTWFTPGWIFTSKAQRLLYYFLEDDCLYSMCMDDLKSFVFQRNKDNRITAFFHYPEKTQSKYNQPNQTHGLCVPINDLLHSVPVKQYQPKAELAKRTLISEVA